MLMWYGQNKAKGFIETNLLPSVCSAISEYIQCDLVFGKVRGVSPLSITLEPCSFGPHKEEFSCGEAPTVKLHLRPFASGREKHLSTEEGIDHWTRTRRLAREEGIARWERERDDGAREAAEVGYFVPERSCGVSQGDGFKGDSKLFQQN
ncbi:hypothetical protein SESBI_12053 [Sesbania bispinosa]|nr:hypothetical protein SESBI_12053 [Sesbania bispinosa]